MEKGTGAVSDGLDYDISGSRAAVQKRPNQVNPKDIKQKVEQVFQLLRCHSGVQLFLEPLDPAHPKFNELQADFINLNKIELNFRSGKYISTF